MKAVLDKNLRKYYKYVYNEWTQPTMTANNVFINHFKVYNQQAFRPNNGHIGLYGNEYRVWMNVYMEFDQPFQPSSFYFWVLSGWSDSSGAYNISFHGSNDGTNYIQLATHADVGEGNGCTINLSGVTDTYKFFRLTLSSGGWAYEDGIRISDFVIQGRIRNTIEGSADDYDFYRDVYQLPYKSNKKYYKYSTDSTLINPNGTITSATGGNGWIIYTKGAYGEVGNMLDTSRSPSYPRWQYSSPNVYAYIKTPQKCIITSYLTTQWCDDNETGRICNHWIIKGYETAEDLLALTNGIVIDDNTWGSRSKGTSKTVTLNNTNGFKYYSIQMVSNFAGGSYCSMGSTKFYARLPYESSSADYDYYIDYKKYYAVKG